MSHVKRTKHQPEHPSIIAGLRLPALRVCPDGKVSTVSRLFGAMPFYSTILHRLPHLQQSEMSIKFATRKIPAAIL